MCLHFPSYAPPSIGIVVAQYSEFAYFGGVAYMCANACAGVIISDSYDSEGVGRVLLLTLLQPLASVLL